MIAAIREEEEGVILSKMIVFRCRQRDHAVREAMVARPRLRAAGRRRVASESQVK